MADHTRTQAGPAALALEELDALLRPPLPRPWLDQAACVDSPSGVFYPDDGADLLEALMICGACPVRQECLDYALTAPELHGVWGGTTPERRRHLLRTKRPHVEPARTVIEEAS